MDFKPSKILLTEGLAAEMKYASLRTPQGNFKISPSGFPPDSKSGLVPGSGFEWGSHRG